VVENLSVHPFYFILEALIERKVDINKCFDLKVMVVAINRASEM